ncbi:hypothetical protein SGI36_21590, partial [Providencia rettgeri]
MGAVADAYTITIHLVHLGAVGAGADLVRNRDTTLAGKGSGSAIVDALDGPCSSLQAVASYAAIDSGGGLAVEGPNPITTYLW